MTRKEANLHLLKILENYLEEHKDIRFGQALVNLGIVATKSKGYAVDPFFDEPQETLRQVLESPIVVQSLFIPDNALFMGSFDYSDKNSAIIKNIGESK